MKLLERVVPGRMRLIGSGCEVDRGSVCQHRPEQLSYDINGGITIWAVDSSMEIWHVHDDISVLLPKPITSAVTHTEHYPRSARMAAGNAVQTRGIGPALCSTW